MNIRLLDLPLEDMLNTIGNYYDKYYPIHKERLNNMCKKLNPNTIKLVKDIYKEIKDL